MGPRATILGIAALSASLAGCLGGGTVDRDLFAHTQGETARRVAAAVPIGTPKAEAIALMTKAGWGCAAGRNVFDDGQRRIQGDVARCEAQPSWGGDFHAKHYFADFLFQDGKVAMRNVWIVDPGI